MTRPFFVVPLPTAESSAPFAKTQIDSTGKALYNAALFMIFPTIDRHPVK